MHPGTHSPAAQRGVALTVVMLFLLVVTIISVVAASNSSVGLKMSANMQDSYSSFQSAEAGLAALMALTGTSNEPFDGDDSAAPFANFNSTNHPLRSLPDGSGSTAVKVENTFSATSCPPKPPGSSVDLFICDYYRVSSEHKVVGKAQTRLELGVVRTVIGSAAR